jgi:hypothetical protein
VRFYENRITGLFFDLYNDLSECVIPAKAGIQKILFQKVDIISNNLYV